MINSGGGDSDIYGAEHAEIRAVLEEVGVLDRDTKNFADRIAAIRLKHHKARSLDS